MTEKPQYPSPANVRQRAKELRWPMTPAETVLWERLKNKQLNNLKFRRQHPIHHFILDFYCHAHQLVIEIDGPIHNRQQNYDESRTEWLTQREFKIIRFTNDEVLNDIDQVLAKIVLLCKTQTHPQMEE